MKPAAMRLLRVSTEYFVAGAEWRKIGGIWSCVRAAPIIKWLVGMNADAAKLALLRMGAEWEWIECPSSPKIFP